MRVMFQHRCADTVQDTAQAAQATDTDIQHSSTIRRFFLFFFSSVVHGTVRHYHVRCVIHTVLSYTHRARLISLKTPAMLMNAVIYKKKKNKVEQSGSVSHSLASQACGDNIITVFVFPSLFF